MHVGLMQIVRKAPTNDNSDFAAAEDGLPAVGQDLMDIAICLDGLAAKAEAREEGKLTFGPIARMSIHNALVLLRNATCQPLVNPVDLRCGTCGNRNSHGLALPGVRT